MQRVCIPSGAGTGARLRVGRLVHMQEAFPRAWAPPGPRLPHLSPHRPSPRWPSSLRPGQQPATGKQRWGDPTDAAPWAYFGYEEPSSAPLPWAGRFSSTPGAATLSPRPGWSPPSPRAGSRFQRQVCPYTPPLPPHASPTPSTLRGQALARGVWGGHKEASGGSQPSWKEGGPPRWDPHVRGRQWPDAQPGEAAGGSAGQRRPRQGRPREQAATEAGVFTRGPGLSLGHSRVDGSGHVSEHQPAGPLQWALRWDSGLRRRAGASEAAAQASRSLTRSQPSSLAHLAPGLLSSSYAPHPDGPPGELSLEVPPDSGAPAPAAIPTAPARQPSPLGRRLRASPQGRAGLRNPRPSTAAGPRAVHWAQLSKGQQSPGLGGLRFLAHLLDYPKGHHVSI